MPPKVPISISFHLFFPLWASPLLLVVTVRHVRNLPPYVQLTISSLLLLDSHCLSSFHLNCPPHSLAADVEAVRDRDPACTSYSACVLYFKGFHAIQTHRIAHCLWTRGQKVMALALQSRMSEVFAVDIHPAARIGKGVLLDHGTGTVIGETATIGDFCSLLQGVTLGGTGKETGDRHPKIGCGVLIGAQATILGNIRIGEGAQVAAGSLVLKPVEPHTMVAGNPAKPVGRVEGDPALTMEQWIKNVDPDGSVVTVSAKGSGGAGAEKEATAPAAAVVAVAQAASLSPSPSPSPTPVKTALSAAVNEIDDVDFVI